MLWSDERYVRVYTRDTVDWQSLSFDAQALLVLLLRKVDRAGLLPLGKHGKRGVAIAIGHPREWPRLEPALEELLADGCIRMLEDGRLFVPNYIDAQEAKSSDKARQQKVRELAQALAAAQIVTQRDALSQNVTDCHTPSHAVTGSHAASHAVTPSRAVPCLAVPSHAVPSHAVPVSASQSAPPEASPQASGEELPDVTHHAEEVPNAVAAFVAQAPLLPEADATPPEKPAPKGPDPEALQALWNRLAPPKGLPRWKTMTPDRKGAARAALAVASDLTQWEAWLSHELARPWNLGQNPSGWKANVDWLLRAKTRPMVADFDPATAAKPAPTGDRPRLGPPAAPPRVSGDRPRI